MSVAVTVPMIAKATHPALMIQDWSPRKVFKADHYDSLLGEAVGEIACKPRNQYECERKQQARGSLVRIKVGTRGLIILELHVVGADQEQEHLEDVIVECTEELCCDDAPK